MDNFNWQAKKNIYLIYWANFFISFSYGIFLLFPLYVNFKGGNESFSGALLLLSGIGTIICVFITKSLMGYIKSHLIGVAGALVYAVGASIISFTSHLNYFLALPLILAGCGWGICYNCAPYCLSRYISEADRARAFSYLSAFAVLGVGIAPTLIDIFKFNLNFHIIFSFAIFSSLTSAVLYSIVKEEAAPTLSIDANNFNKISFLEIFKTQVKYPLIMVFLGACAFTVMMNFQSTYAEKMGLNYAIFYLTYSLTVIISRFFISPFLARYNKFKVTILLVSFMLLGLISFFFIPKYNLLYPISAALFGIGYGLTYPHIQAIAVNLTDKRLHKDVISYFSLFYFVAIYTFPFIAGKIIVYWGYAVLIAILVLIIIIDVLVATIQAMII